MRKEKHSPDMDTLVRICETLDCGILDVIELVSDEPSVTEKRKNDKTNNKKRD
nr:helix-turn-helix domain-containing protein [uncultured Acetatifactor sp.]